MNASSRVLARSGSSLSWSDGDDTPSEVEEWDFVLPRSKTHVAPDFSDPEEDHQPVQDQEGDQRTAHDPEEDDHSSIDHKEDRPPALDHEEALCETSTSGLDTAGAQSPNDRPWRHSQSFIGHISFMFQFVDGCSIWDPQISSNFANDHAWDDDEVYFPKAVALRSLRAEFDATPRNQVHELVQVESWLYYLYRISAKNDPGIQGRLSGLDKTYFQPALLDLLDEHLSYFYSRQYYHWDIHTIAYRHVFRPFSARAAKTINDLSIFARFTCSPEDSVEESTSVSQESRVANTEPAQEASQENTEETAHEEPQETTAKHNREIETPTVVVTQHEDQTEAEVAKSHTECKPAEGHDTHLKCQIHGLELQTQQLQLRITQLELKNKQLKLERKKTKETPPVAQEVINKHVQEALAKSHGEFSKLLDEIYAANTAVSSKSSQDSAPEAASSKLSQAAKLAQPEAARNPAYPTFTARTNLKDRTTASKERADRVAQRATTAKPTGANMVNSARMKAQKSSGDRGGWLLSGSSSR